MAEELAVWLYGMNVVYLTETDNIDSPAHLHIGSPFPDTRRVRPLLLLTLPVRPERFTQGVVRSFLDGLLPEGDTRRFAAADLRLRADDTAGLIGELGRDCAGALVIQPGDEVAPPPPTSLTAEQLSEEELADLIATSRTSHSERAGGSVSRWLACREAALDPPSPWQVGETDRRNPIDPHPEARDPHSSSHRRERGVLHAPRPSPRPARRRCRDHHRPESEPSRDHSIRLGS